MPARAALLTDNAPMTLLEGRPSCPLFWGSLQDWSVCMGQSRPLLPAGQGACIHMCWTGRHASMH